MWERHEEAGRLLHEGLAEMGLELFAAEGFRLPELTTVKVPDGVDSAAVRALLLERHDIEIGAGAGPYAATVWRIGLMGHNARPDAVLRVLALASSMSGRGRAGRGWISLPGGTRYLAASAAWGPLLPLPEDRREGSRS